MPGFFSQPDPARFEQLLRPHLDALFRLAYRLTRSTPDAEDLIQDLLIKLLPRTRELEKIESLRPWLARVLYRLFIDSTRRAARSPLHLAVDNNGNSDDETDSQINQLQGSPSAEETLSNTQQHHEIICKINQLDERQRTVVILHDIEGYTLKEIEQILDCPLGTLKSRLHRARNRLKTLLR